MRARALLVAAILGTTLPVVASPHPCAAATPVPGGVHHAGLVVQFGDGSTREFCVEFADPHTTGLDILRRSGLPVVYQDYGGGNVAVCKIAGEGCDYPKQPCFCRCAQTSDCTFWGYYLVDPKTGSWRFPDVGAGTHEVADGELQGWHWGKQSTGGGNPPLPASMTKVCANGEKIALAAATRAPRKSGPPVAAAIAFGAALLALAVFAARATRRRGEPS
jgi:hypothetical protein